MKIKFPFLLITIFSLSSLAFANTENRGDNRWLPKHGEITSDQLCHFNNESMLRITTPNKTIETSVNYIGKVCVKKEYQMDYNGYHLLHCTRYEEEVLTDSLVYTTENFESTDVFHEHPVIVEKRIPACE
jgi:hypothetical protein